MVRRGHNAPYAPQQAGAGGGTPNPQLPRWGPGPCRCLATPRPLPPPPRRLPRAPAPSMAWQSWPASCLWVASCGLLLLVLALLLSPRSCRARRTLRGLFMARSSRLLFRIGLVPGSDGMRALGRRARGAAAARGGSGLVPGEDWRIQIQRRASERRAGENLI